MPINSIHQNLLNKLLKLKMKNQEMARLCKCEQSGTTRDIEAMHKNMKQTRKSAVRQDAKFLKTKQS